MGVTNTLRAPLRGRTHIGSMRWRDLLVALSLSNLVYLRCWTELLSVRRDELYWLKDFPPSPPHFVALMINVVLLALVFAGLISGLRSRHGAAFRLAPVFCLLVLVSLINSLRTLVGQPGNSLFLRFVERRLPAIGLILAIIVITAVVAGGIRALKPAYTVLVMLSPFVALAFGQAGYRIATYAAQGRDGPFAVRLPAKPAGSPRVLWVIFDEWDDGLTFRDRPRRIQLPEIDRLRHDSVFASQAITANFNTDWSIPSLVSGMPVDSVHPDGPSEMMLLPPGSAQWLRWSEQANVFRKARDLGYNTAVVAWAIPYCRVLKADLTDCSWWAGSNQYNSLGNTFWQILYHQPRSLLENIYRSPFGQPLSTSRHLTVYENVLARALQAAPDGGIGLTMLHMPVPHPPYFYNAATGKNDFGATPILGILKQNQQGYIDALELTDRTIGAIRREMEKAGAWDTTTVVFSSDHPYRHHDRLDGKPRPKTVPYLIKMAKQSQGFQYDKPFSAILTQKLILACLSGELSRPEQVAAWLDAHCSDYPIG
jgi:hypothetical protein